jgi:polar amino acid transport system substrate-binding protein
MNMTELPIIAMTANAMAEDIEKARNSGMNDHISKPINVKDMFTTMAKWITPSDPEAFVETASDDEPDHAFDIHDIEGIDSKLGLLTTAQNEKLYRKLLTKFRDSYQDFSKTFEAALASEDEAEAERTAHTLKGVAGNIGAKEVQAKAALLEAACKENPSREQLASLLNDVVAELAVVLGGLASIDAVADTASTTSSLQDPAVISALLDELRELLNDDDTAAKDVVDKLYELKLERQQKLIVDRIYAAIDAYDFELALTQLDEMTAHFAQAASTHPATAASDFDKETLSNLMTELRTLLEDDDTAAKDLVDELEAMNLPAEYRSSINGIYTAIDDYDFEAALEELDKMSQHLES